MKKNTILLTGFLLIALLTVGCNLKNKLSPSDTDSSSIAGTWNGCGNALGKTDLFRGDYLNLIIDSEGAYSLSDIEQNSIISSGTFTIDSDSKITVQSDDNETGALPKGWEATQESSELSYLLPDSDHLILTMNEISYVFEKSEGNDAEATDTETTVSPLLDLAENDVWYSNNGETTEETTYELALYDKYAELYSVDSVSGKSAFITNFIYLSNEGDSFSFYTSRKKDRQFPAFLQELPEGISKIDLKLTASDESLIMDYNGPTMTFYNNVIYGLNSGSTAYSINDTHFYWSFDSVNHYCYFATEPDTDSMYLYISDSEADSDSANTIRGQITIDEAKQTIQFDFDKKASKLTADTDSALFKTFRKLDKSSDGKLIIPFKLNETKLNLKTKEYLGKNYTVNLERN